MLKKIMVRICTMCVLAFALPVLVLAETVGVFFDSAIPQVQFAAGDIKMALESKGFTVEMYELPVLNSSYAKRKVVIALAGNSSVIDIFTEQGGTIPSELGEQAYALRTTTKEQTSYWVLGGDENGAMYGGLQIAENISSSGFGGAYNTQESPFILNRGMKLNLPLDKRIPTYVGGWSSNSAQKAIPHVWDINFWKKLIDQQTRFRYNALTVWVHHPFPALVKLADYPKAALPGIEGFEGYVNELNHDQRVAFWREVMQYAHARGMKFYFFNWNIYVDYATTHYPAITRSQNNATTIDYMYKSMKALIETYPELDGFGISAGDGMEGENTEKTKWTWQSIGKAVKDYLSENPSRKFNLIHRGIGTNPEIWNNEYAPLKTVPNVTMNYSVKYAMAHMYSAPAPRWGSELEKVAKLGLKSWITLRNDDYFYFNWGDPKFVRDFMTGIPEKKSVVGLYIGSDGYNPSRTYFCKNDAMNGQLEVERRWYMEMLWGRISYNPQISDDVFRNQLAKRYPALSSDNLFQAWSLASRSLPKVTELVMGNWSLDFHWYPEGCWSDPGRETGFRTIDGFANSTTVARGSNLCNIANSAAGNCNGKKSSYTVADEMQADAEKAHALIKTLKSNGNADLEMAINNIKQMTYLSYYYAHKIRGATYKKAGQTDMARDEMGKAYCWWMTYSRTMEIDYYGDSFRNLSILPDWKFADAAVLKEYTDLGGVGTPSCETMSYQINLSVNDPDGGSVTGEGIFVGGQNIEANAIPNENYRFMGWMENSVVVSKDESYSFTCTNDRRLVANFRNKDACDLPWNNQGFSVNNGSIQKTLGPINIACAANGATISLTVESVGNLEDADYCKVYYKVDGGELKEITVLNGITAFKILTINNVVGTYIEFFFDVKNSFSDEYYYVKDINIEGGITSVNLPSSNDINIYPNPVTKILNITFPDSLTNRKIKIYNAIGEVVYAIQTNKSKIEINVKKLNLTGLTMVQVESEKIISNHKIVVQ